MTDEKDITKKIDNIETKIDTKIEVKSFNTEIIDIRDTCLFIFVNGWTCAVNFSNPKEQISKYKKGDIITVEYTGDLEKDTTGGYFLNLLPLK